MDLLKSKCKPCEGGIPKLAKFQTEILRTQLNPEWIIHETDKITRTFLFVNYLHTMDFVNKIAKLAEDEGHHPVMHIYYGKLELELWTHAINGLSENDFILAAKIDKL
jgi:4a-hydroxytetrahydrobiopterin dehydratase